MLYANRIGDVSAIAIVALNVVRADWLFTLPAINFQPIYGYIMMQHAGIPLLTPWLWISFALYLLAGA